MHTTAELRITHGIVWEFIWVTRWGYAPISTIHSTYYYYYLDMHTSDQSRSLAIVVRRDWITGSYVANIRVLDARDGIIDEHEQVYGPLWEAYQVEASVFAAAGRLRDRWAVLTD